MLVFLVAILEALGYLGAVPVRVAFCLRTGDRARFGVGVGTFNARSAMRRAERDPRHKKKKRRRARVDPKAAMRLLARLRVERIVLRGSLGLGNAAATALACGGLAALGMALDGRTALDIDIAPIFEADAPRLELRGMIRARLGQIIIAAARSGIHRK